MVTLPDGESLEPTDAEEQLAYELLRPGPFSMSPMRWVAKRLALYREQLLIPLDAFAERLPPREAAELRAIVMRARGQT